MTILERIVETKRREVITARDAMPLADIIAKMADIGQPRDFLRAVTRSSTEQASLIAEVKKSSPSAGLIRADFDPVCIARAYEAGGAAALSVLTDVTYFQGQLDYIRRIKEAVHLPVLRKDFLMDEYQVYESRLSGADAVLLIMEVLGGDRVADFVALARELGMAVLVEVHTPENLDVLLAKIGPPVCGHYLLGINNRDLTTQRTDLATMKRLAERLPTGTRFVAESGIRSRTDVLDAVRAGALAVLVGESLLRQEDLEAAVRELCAGTN